MRRTQLVSLVLTATSLWAGGNEGRFAPANTLVGIGAGRRDLSPESLLRRTELMIESQTFGILRDPRATTGAQRITSPALQKIFKEAERQSGVPASVVEAIAFLESWGESSAQSPTGPKGAMQISAGTARSMGLKIVYATRYRVVTERRPVKAKNGRTVTKTVRRKSPYQVLVRDERLMPEKAIPAAARYLARLEQRYGGLDWAIFAYHCGEGCVGSMLELAKRSEGISEPYTVSKVFFGGNPAHNRELYEAIEREMDRDWSPTYWFRIMRAQQLLKMYREDPIAFRNLAAQYRYEVDPAKRAPHRLSVWLRNSDLTYQSCEDLKREQGKTLARAFDNEAVFGFKLRKDEIGAFDRLNQEYYLQASPSAIGTLAYIAFETRRLHDSMKRKGEKFVPLEVTSLVKPLQQFQLASQKRGRDESFWHCTGQVFDIDFRNLPLGEREALDFVLHDMGWLGYLGFIDEGSGTWHVGASPSSREFFGRIFDEALKSVKE